MKKQFIIILAMIVAVGIIPTHQSRAEELSSKLKGRILLQVESKGEAWYVNPKDSKRYYMANGSEAYNIMRTLGVGVTNKDLAKIKVDKVFAKKQQGKIFLQIERHGEAYYIDINGVAHYLKDGPAAYGVMRQLGLGIKTVDLIKINLADKDKATSTAPVVAVDTFDVKISSLTCVLTDVTKVISGSFSLIVTYERAIVRGTAQGPVGARIELPILVWSDDVWDCGDWSLTDGALISVGSTCTRKEGQPETINWSVDTGGEESIVSSMTRGVTKSYTAKIYSKDIFADNLVPRKEAATSTVCQ